jgi:hypothetical protein
MINGIDIFESKYIVTPVHEGSNRSTNEDEKCENS